MVSFLNFEVFERPSTTFRSWKKPTEARTERCRDSTTKRRVTRDLFFFFVGKVFGNTVFGDTDYKFTNDQ